MYFNSLIVCGLRSSAEHDLKVTLPAHNSDVRRYRHLCERSDVATRAATPRTGATSPRTGTLAPVWPCMPSCRQAEAIFAELESLFHQPPEPGSVHRQTSQNVGVYLYRCQCKGVCSCPYRQKGGRR
jgi:hypothetical protein